MGAEENIASSVNKEFEKIDDTKENNESIERFICDLEEDISENEQAELNQKKKIEVRQTREKNHSKVYIFNPKDKKYKSGIILGSSNFTESGLEKQYEMNYEIKNTQDIEFANKFFDKLWKTSEILENEVLSKIITENREKYIGVPYDLFLKALYSIYGKYLDYKALLTKYITRTFQLWIATLTLAMTFPSQRPISRTHLPVIASRTYPSLRAEGVAIHPECNATFPKFLIPNLLCILKYSVQLWIATLLRGSQ